MSSVSNPIKASPDFIADPYHSFEESNGDKLWSIVRSPIQAVAMHFLKDSIYYASSENFKKRLDERRLQESRDALFEIGGEEVLLETEDGCLIDSMFFDVNSFKRKIEELGGAFVNSGGERHIEIASGRLHRLMSKMNANISGNMIELPKIQTDQEISHEPNVMILTQGNAGIYATNRLDILRFLLKGMSIMVFDIRGTGRSTGTPSEAGTYNDIEAVYQYLKLMKKFSNDRIHVWGYCLGSGPATELAYRHPGVNLYIDRAAARVTDIATDVAEIAALGNQQPNESTIVGASRAAIRAVLPAVLDKTVISYNNAEKIAKIRGRIFFLYGSYDNVIPPWSSDRLDERLSEENTANSDRFIVIDSIGHGDDWSFAAEDTLNSYMGNVGACSVRVFPETDTRTDLEKLEEIIDGVEEFREGFFQVLSRKLIQN